MKPTLLFALLAISMPFLTMGQTTPKTNNATGNPEQTIKQIQQELVTAITQGNTAPFERYLADTFVFTAADGGIQTRSEWLADLKSGDLKLQSTTNEDVKVQAYGDAAVVTYRSTDKGTYKGKDISGQYRWTDVFVKQKGGWRWVATQGTHIAQP
jgi:ketosteroid isomerase-like protein